MEGKTEFVTNFYLKGGMTERTQLDEYRSTWSTETGVMRGERFATENTAAQGAGVPAAFRVGLTRLLAGAPQAVERVRQAVVARAGAGNAAGIRGLARSFRIMDDNDNKRLSRAEFVKGLRDYGLTLPEPDMDQVIRFFDRNQDGTIDFDEFLR